MFHEAAEAWRRQDYEQTIDMLARASRLDPLNAQLLLDLGRAHGMRYDHAAAERHFERAVRVSRNQPEVLAEAGRRCQEFGSDDMARRYFDRAIARPAAAPGVLVALAEIHERQARLDDAAALVDRALAAEPECAMARLARARLARLGGRLESAETTLRSLLAGTSADRSARVRACYELGHVLDRQGRYDEAMTAFLDAKSLLRPASATSLALLGGIQDRVRELETTMSQAVFDRWFAARDTLQPARRLALLCGHPRSGTTLLERVLDCHPDIVTAEETHVLHDEAYLPLTRGFAPDRPVLEVLDAAPLDALHQSRRDYFRFSEVCVGKTLGPKLLVDKNPALTVLIPALARIFPDAAVLVAIRDPRDICLSCFMQPLPINPVSSAYLTLEGTVRQYASVMGLWRTLRPRLRNACLEIRYEDVIDDLEAESRRVLAFLGVDWTADVLRFHEHARNKLLRSPSYAEVTQPVFRRAVGRWRHYARFLDPWMRPLEPFLRDFGYE
jgi:tetratricopeptide (TPR) repeat protein